MDNSPLISVLMTAFNREKYIEESIKSVLASDYENFELIIVDDASTDRTVEIANKFANDDARVRVIVNDKNLGDYANRNNAAQFALGKYLKYLDSDDYIYPYGLKTMVNMMMAHPHVGWGLCVSKVDFISDGPLPLELSPKQAYEHHYLGKSLFNKSPMYAIIKKELFFAENGFLADRMSSDFEFWHRLAQKHNLLIMPDGLIWYRKHPEQEFNDFPKYMKVYENIRVEYLLNKNCPLDKKQIKKAFDLRIRGLKNQALYFFFKTQFRAAYQNLELIFFNIFQKLKY